MKYSQILYMSIRNLLVHKMRTVLTVVGVVIGISAILILVSIGYGLQKMVTEEITKFDAFYIIDVSSGESSVVKLDDENVQRFAGLAAVESVGTEADLAGKIKYGSSVTDVVCYALDANYRQYERISASSGGYVNFASDKKEIVLSSSIIKLLGLGEADKIIGEKISADLIITKNLTSDNSVISKKDEEFTVVGVVDDDSSAYAYISDSVANELGVVNYSTVKVKLEDQVSVDATRNSIENMGFKTEHVGDTLEQINQVFSVLKIFLGILGFIAMVVALLGMFNTLTISLLERMREVGYLKILGARNKDIFLMFVTESVMIGLFGGIAGITYGIILEIAVNAVISGLAERAGAFPITLLYTPYYFAAFMAIFALVIGILTGIYPARKAVRVKPLDVLRYE
jgi:putative ABC transport system permease protein